MFRSLPPAALKERRCPIALKTAKKLRSNKYVSNLHRGIVLVALPPMSNNDSENRNSSSACRNTVSLGYSLPWRNRKQTFTPNLHDWIIVHYSQDVPRPLGKFMWLSEMRVVELYRKSINRRSLYKYSEKTTIKFTGIALFFLSVYGLPVRQRI
jgi:hypothetical protein